MGCFMRGNAYAWDSRRRPLAGVVIDINGSVKRPKLSWPDKIDGPVAGSLEKGSISMHHCQSRTLKSRLLGWFFIFNR